MNQTQPKNPTILKLNWTSSSNLFAVIRTASGQTLVAVDEKAWPEFQKMVQKAHNTYPDFSADMKEFGDVITNGSVLQNYQAQQGVQRDQSE